MVGYRRGLITSKVGACIAKVQPDDSSVGKRRVIGVGALSVMAVDNNALTSETKACVIELVPCLQS